MESSRFDNLTKALATTTTRRQALKAIATTTVGSILGLSGIGNVFAKGKPCTRNGKHCNSKTECCPGLVCTNGKCTCPPGVCNSSCSCPSGQTCVNGFCCPSSQVCGGVCCSGTCVNGLCTCPSGCSTLLANGTCAQTCTGVPDSCTCGNCAGDSSQPAGFGVCSTETSDGTCTSDVDCPSGYYCNTNGGPPAHCFQACC